MAKITTGTIKIKNIKGEIEEFYPNVCDANISFLTNIKNRNVINKLLGLETIIDNISGKIKVMYNEANYKNTKTFIKKTLIAQLEFDENEFVYIVNTSLTSRTTGVPLVAHSFGDSSSKIIIDWGDETIVELTKADVENDPSVLYHTYSDDSKYFVSIKIFGDVYIDTINSYAEPNEIATYDSYYRGIQYFKNTVTDILSPLCFTGTIDEYSSTTDMYCIFANCVLLESIPDNLFSNYNVSNFYKAFYNCRSLKLSDTFNMKLDYSENNSQSFTSCFEGCTSLKKLPDGMFPINTWEVYSDYVFKFDNTFKNCTGLTELPVSLFDIYQDENVDLMTATFDGCFEGCTNLVYVPVKLFEDFNGLSFARTFKGCTKLQNINAGLFDNMNNVTNYSECFKDCIYLTSVNQFLFYNSTATNFTGCFENCNNLLQAKFYFSKSNAVSCSNFVTNHQGSHIVVCVPQDSAKENSFSNIVDSTGIILKNECDLYSFEFTYESMFGIENGISVPLVLDYQNVKGINLFIDWGDGFFTSIDNNSYVNIENSELYSMFRETDTNLIHCFNESTDGQEYTAKVISDSWDKIYWGTALSSNYNLNDYVHHLYPFKWCIKSINTPFPKITKLFYYDLYYTNGNYNLISENYTNNLMNICCNCSKLTSVCSDLFKNNPQVTIFYNCFYKCTSLESIPTDLFKYNIEAINFNNCFYRCTSLTTVPTDLFKYNVNVTNFGSCFASCTSLASIPENLFKYNTDATDFSGCFNNCTSLASIPQNLFKYNTDATNFIDCFSNCLSLLSIPEDLFKYNTNATNFSNCFMYCASLTTIGNYAFNNCSNATTFQNCFYNCTNLTSIPEHLFDSCINVINFSNCFYGCSSLTSIPDKLFFYCNKIIEIYGCFQSCTSLTSIPTGLFDSCTSILSFGRNGYSNGCFYGCTSLTTIPEHLFDSCINATTFSSCFASCTSLTSIPQNLFKYNTDATVFDYCFQGCTSITSIPLTLFYSCNKATNFDSCFYGCSSLYNFKIIITSRNVNHSVYRFVSNKSNVIRKICVPYGSNTYSSFNSYASSYGYTVSTTEYDCMNYIEYMIDTEATTQGAKLGAIPIVNTSNTEKITVDWGDNNTDELYASDFTLGGYIHEYEQAGEYNIGVYFIHSDIVNLVSVAGDTTNATTEPVRIFRDTYLGA